MLFLRCSGSLPEQYYAVSKVLSVLCIDMLLLRCSGEMLEHCYAIAKVLLTVLVFTVVAM